MRRNRQVDLGSRDLSGTLDGAGGVGGLLATEVGDVWYFPLYDNNGNVTDYVSETGEVVASYAYDAFGRTITQSGTMADTFPFRFSTKYYDSETGLYYYGYRYYSPELGRWITRDPIEENGGDNLYAFCGNNGINRIDPFGQKAFIINVHGTEAELKTGIEDQSQRAFEATIQAVDSAIAKLQPVSEEQFKKCWNQGKIKFNGMGAPHLQLTKMQYFYRIRKERKSRSVVIHQPTETILINQVKEFAALANEDYDSLTVAMHGEWDPIIDKPTGMSPFGDSLVNTTQYKQKIETALKAVPSFKGKFKFVSCYQSWEKGKTQAETTESSTFHSARDKLSSVGDCLHGDFIPVKMIHIVGGKTVDVY